MDLLSNLALGFQTAVSPATLLYCFIGVFVGTLIGVLPGIGALSTISLLLPLTYHLDPTAAVVLLAGVYYGAQYGGSTASILLNLPGTPSSAVACLDGYPMSRQGRAGVALFMTTAASFIGATIGVLLMTLFTPAIADLGLKFGPYEYFAMMLLGLIAASTLASGSPVKGMAMVVLGLLLGMIGTDVQTGQQRFDFGIPELTDGLNLVALAMGVFGVSEVVNSINRVKRAGDRECHRRSVEVAAVVGHHDGRAGRRDVAGAGDVELGVGEEQRVGEAQRQPLDLHVDDGDLGHRGHLPGRVGCRRQVERWPAPSRGHQHHPRVRVDHERVAHGSEEGGVVDAVAVGEAGGEIHAVALRPLLHCGQLAGAPHERAVQRAVVRAVVVQPVAGGHHVVQPQAAGQRRHQVVGRGGGQHDRPPSGTVLLEQGGSQWLDHRRQRVRGVLRGALHDGPRAALGERHGLAGQCHGRQRLAHRVEHAVEQVLARDRPGHQAGLTHRPGEHLPRRPGQQGAVEVEERSALGGRHGRSL